MHRRAGTTDCIDEDEEDDNVVLIDSLLSQPINNKEGGQVANDGGLAARQREAAARWASEIINNQTLPHLFAIGKFLWLIFHLKWIYFSFLFFSRC